MENDMKNLADHQTLVHILKQRAATTPDKVAYIFLEDGENIETPITYAELDLRARKVAAKLQQKNPMINNERVLLIYPQGIEFIVAFFGTLYAGATAVLVYPPSSKKMAKRLNGIIEDCGVSIILSITKVISRMSRMDIVGDVAKKSTDNINIAAQELINTDDLLSDENNHLVEDFIEQEIAGSQIAFLQYTSGSTGTPKGVMVSHDNLIANQIAIKEIYQHTDKTIFVGWLPLIHDMGLIGNVLQPMYLGITLIFMSPLHFVQSPIRWLRAIDKYRATTSGGPNFAYDLCASKIDPEDVKDLDLSCWEIAFNGAEPVRKQTIDRFNQKFAHCGLRPESHMAVYGLAEATLIVSGTEKNTLLNTGEDVNYMSSGKIVAADTLKVVDTENLTELAEGQEGEIWFSSASVAMGYWNRLEETNETFRAKLAGCDLDFMRTGDTGFIQDGQLHVTGRIKDVIIVQGKNFHAEDIEWSMSDTNGIRQGCCAAVSMVESDKESLLLIAGATTKDSAEMSKAIKEIRSAVYEDHQLQIDRIVLIKPKELPMTTSGKVQRALALKMYQNNEFTVLSEQTLEQHATQSSDEQENSNEFVAASTDAERELTKIWSGLLNIPAEEISINNNFFDLGGSSLTMLELANRLNVTMELLFRYPTINSYLYRTSEYEFPDVDQDMYLAPAEIDESLSEPTHISLITGGTGFFGLHFLQSMMRRTQDHFVLLVRGESQQALQNKLDSAVSYFNMEKDIDQSRITLVKGDLSQKHVGIPDDKYAWIKDNVDKIYHIGSHVNNWLPYEGIREINVDGTRSLLTLARTGRKKEFHYTSTSTFSPEKDDQSVFLETDSIDRSEINRYFGYDISKYASETMCKRSRDEGFVCNIYRLVWVGGQIESGLTKVNDGFNIMLRILITLGAFPKGNYLHDIVPVDLMADSMASIQGKCENVDFNITSQSKESIDMKRLAVMLREMGYHLDEVSRTEFVDRLKNYPAEKWDEHCRSYRQLVIRLFEDPTPKVESFYDGSNFRQYMDQDVLAKMEEKFIDSWFEKTVAFLVQNNALPTASSGQYQEEQAQIAKWNNTAKSYPLEQTLPQLFEAQVVKSPNAIAIAFEGNETSYLEVNRRSNQIAQALLKRGVKPGGFIGLSVERSALMIESMLAILKVGCAYLPLDPTYPISSLDFMIEDCASELILVDRESAVSMKHHQNKLMLLDEAELDRTYQAWSDNDLVLPAIETSASDLAYVIYTSGTTGKPKGVLVEHASVVNHNLSSIESFRLTSKDKLLQFSTINFDSFVEEVFPTLFSGATLVLIAKKDLTNQAKLESTIVDNKVSVLKFSTAYWHTLSTLNVEQLGVRLVAIGGEEVNLIKYNQWRSVNTNIPLINTYGPTETTVTASCSVLEGQLEKITIGKPIANTQLHILSSDLKPVAIGFTGELFIAGKGVTRGYLNRDEINDSVFLNNPFVNGEKMYKSGDLARWNKDGEIEFLGRSDNQVKVRGYRIELGAIESVIGDFDAIESVAVVLKQVDTSKKIVAYLTTTSELDVTLLREYLEKILPSYMIPNMILQLAEIPINPNGKIDRKVLEEMPINLEESIDFATPTTSDELKMASVWEKVLNVNGIGLNDDFMALGGHSLLVMSLVNEVNSQFNTRISINDIFEYPTIGKLLKSIQSQEKVKPNSNLVKFPEHTGCTKSATKARPLFLVHGLGGHLASFYPLVKNLKETLLDKHKVDISVYGLEANGFNEGEEHFATVEEMTNKYLGLIRETQPHGPYLIGGWSYGVSIAYHIAQELIRAGEEVEVFISIDAEAPNVPKDFEAFLQENNIVNLNDLYQDNTLNSLLGNFGERFGFIASDNECAKQQFYRFLGYSKTDTDEQVERLSKVAISNLFNARGFKPNTINPMNTLLVRASSSNFNNYANDWFQLLESKMVSSLTLNGDHWSIMQEPELAEQLARMVAGSTVVESA
jgi:amino acid adenylation domain-containing protein/thioester reductase-like protein